MEAISYRIRITAIDRISRSIQKDSVFYLVFGGGHDRTRAYSWGADADAEDVDHQGIVECGSLAIANVKLGAAAVKDIRRAHQRALRDPEHYSPSYNLDIVKVVFTQSNEHPGEWTRLIEEVVKQVLPKPTVLDKLAMI